MGVKAIHSDEQEEYAAIRCHSLVYIISMKNKTRIIGSCFFVYGGYGDGLPRRKTFEDGMTSEPPPDTDNFQQRGECRTIGMLGMNFSVRLTVVNAIGL